MRCRGVFRTHRGFVKGCFAKPLDILYALEAEFMWVIYASPYASDLVEISCDLNVT